MTAGKVDEFHGVILDSINDGVFTVDEQWKITSFNQAAERITGVKRRQAIGRYCSDVFRASICEASCALRETLATGRPVVNRRIYILGVKGQRIPVSISTAVFKDRDGKVIGGVETFRDLTLVEDLRKELEHKHSFADIVGHSAAMQHVFQLLPLLADSASTVLIQGASGTGKELFARAIHALSRRKDYPFVAINCGALPDTLLESELFGYKAGAFTDARRDKPGRFALAEGGTILLDEIGDISPAMQTRLLRVLQERVFEPLGSVEPVATDVRVLAATHQDLTELVQAGKFREDLFYRIHVVRLELPRLCQRREDIPLLIDHFVAKFNRLQGKDVVGVADDVLARLMEYDFPGNVRELENIIEHAFVLCRSGLIQVPHLPVQVRGSTESRSLAEASGLTLAAAEQWLIRDALGKHQGNRTAAAKQLGIDPSTLHRKIRAYGIDIPSPKTRRP
jgi:PAS domain S-box-containing protein